MPLGAATGGSQRRRTPKQGRSAPAEGSARDTQATRQPPPQRPVMLAFDGLLTPFLPNEEGERADRCCPLFDRQSSKVRRGSSSGCDEVVHLAFARLSSQQARRHKRDWLVSEERQVKLAWSPLFASGTTSSSRKKCAFVSRLLALDAASCFCLLLALNRDDTVSHCFFAGRQKSARKSRHRQQKPSFQRPSAAEMLAPQLSGVTAVVCSAPRLQQRGSHSAVARGTATAGRFSFFSPPLKPRRIDAKAAPSSLSRRV